MGLFDKLKEPVFLKEDGTAQLQLEKLKELRPLLNQEGQEKLDQEIKCLEYGIAGEKNIAYELKNSFLPMYILHDIYLKSGDFSAQIDYLVITRKICFVIECKNLYGDIEINNNGDFIRTMNFGGCKIREGIYSPITQNQRHLDVMKKIKTEQRGNAITKFMTNRCFADFNQSIVVLANPRTVLYAKYAKKEVKEKVIRADQLVAYIKDQLQKSKEAENSDKQMLAWAESYMKLHIERPIHCTEKYEPYKMGFSNKEAEEGALLKALKSYRLEKSREEKIKPYFLYNDKQLEELIRKKPETKEELKMLYGFGETKAEKYGKDILEILKKYSK